MTEFYNILGLVNEIQHGENTGGVSIVHMPPIYLQLILTLYKKLRYCQPKLIYLLTFCAPMLVAKRFFYKATKVFQIV